MKTLESGTSHSSGLDSLFDEYTKHLDITDVQFLEKWNSLLNTEEAEVFRFRNELWTMLSHERESLGRYIRVP